MLGADVDGGLVDDPKTDATDASKTVSESDKTVDDSSAAGQSSYHLHVTPQIMEAIQNEMDGAEDEEEEEDYIYVGCVVGRTNGNSQLGFCRGIKETATYQIVGTDRVIVDVSKNRCWRVCPSPAGLIVYLDSWIGTVTETRFTIHLSLADSSKCVMGPFKLRTYFKKGKVLHIPLDLLLQHADWPEPQSKSSKLGLKNVIEEVLIEAIEDVLCVSWQLQAYGEPEKPKPKSVISGDDIRRLKVPAEIHAPSSYAERFRLVISKDDLILPKDQWLMEQKRLDVEGNKDSPSEGKELNFLDGNDVTRCGEQQGPIPIESIRLEPGSEVEVEIIGSFSSAQAHVLWQDGSVEENIPLPELYPSEVIGDTFFPGDIVIRKEDGGWGDDFGAVQNVDCTGWTARVKWFRSSPDKKDAEPFMVEENEVSLYDVEQYFSYFDSVVMPDVGFQGKDCTIGLVLGGDLNGKVQVGWAEGHISWCWPHHLWFVEPTYNSPEYEIDKKYEMDNLFIRTVFYSNLIANIEKCRLIVTRLFSIQNPSVQVPLVILSNLLRVYDELKNHHVILETTVLSEMEELIPEWLEELRRVCPPLLVGDQNDGSGQSLFGAFIPLLEVSTCLDNISTRLDAFMISTNAESGRGKKRSVTGELVQEGSTSPEASLEGTKTDSDTGSEKGTDQTASNVHGAANSTLNPQVTVSDVARFLYALLRQQEDAAADINVLSRIADKVVAERPEMIIKKVHAMMDEEANSLYESEDDSLHESEEADPLHENEHADQGENNTGNLAPQLPESSASLLNDPEMIKDDGKTSEGAAQVVAESQDKPAPVIPEDNLLLQKGVFSIAETAPDSHTFKMTSFKPADPKGFCKRVKEELALLSMSLPAGIWVKAFGDRMDLFSAMIRGPEKTPYEDGLFIFDIQLPGDYPLSPPKCHYISFSSGKLNPNLYVDGMVCISLLGTWTGKSTEKWTRNSNLLQVVVSIQGLILVDEPYFNEPGYEVDKGTPHGREDSQLYNEFAILQVVQAMKNIVKSPHQVFAEEIVTHVRTSHERFCSRLLKFKAVSERFIAYTPASSAAKTWQQFLSEENQQGQLDAELPDFPLLPVSKGFCLSLQNYLDAFRQAVVDQIKTSPK